MCSGCGHVRKPFAQSTNCTPDAFEAQSCKSQVVAGTNYVAVVKAGSCGDKNGLVTLKVFKGLSIDAVPKLSDVRLNASLADTCPPDGPSANDPCSHSLSCDFRLTECADGTKFASETATCVAGRWMVIMAGIQCPPSDIMKDGGLSKPSTPDEDCEQAVVEVKDSFAREAHCTPHTITPQSCQSQVVAGLNYEVIVKYHCGDDHRFATLKIFRDSGKDSHAQLKEAVFNGRKPNECPEESPTPDDECFGAMQCDYNVVVCSDGTKLVSLMATCSTGRWEIMEADIACPPSIELPDSIEKPGSEVDTAQECPARSPSGGDDCTGSISCDYNFVECADGTKLAADTASCVGGRWMKLSAMIICPHLVLEGDAKLETNGEDLVLEDESSQVPTALPAVTLDDK